MGVTAPAPAEIAVLTGDAEAIASSGRRWRLAAMRTALAASEVAACAVIDDFTGDEATTWERRLHGDTADVLSTLASATPEAPTSGRSTFLMTGMHTSKGESGETGVFCAVRSVRG